MATADNFCADCGTHFNDTKEGHAATYHDGGLFRGIMGGNYRDFQRNYR